MMRLHFIGEGPRDEVTLPQLVRSLSTTEFDSHYKNWKDYRLQGHFGRKLQFALIEARDLMAAGIIALVDRDRGQSERLDRLRKARVDDRQSYPPLPTALGEPVPHFEAWLLDDQTAVREVLALPPEIAVPNVLKVKNPKASLSELYRQGECQGATEMELLHRMAAKIVPKRCAHQKQTGFKAFQDELREEVVGLLEFER